MICRINRAFIVVALLLAGSRLEGQQLRLSSLSFLSPYTFNVAYAGMDESLSMSGFYRRQWAGLPGAPESQSANAHLPLYFLKGAMGLSFEKERMGAQEFTSVALSYGQRIELGKNSTLELAVGGGWRQNVLDGSLLRAPDGSYQEGTFFTHNDVLLPEAIVRGNAPMMQAGLYFKHPHLEAGFAVHNLLESTLDYGFSEGGDFVFKRHFIGNVTTTFAVGENLLLQPTVLYLSDLNEQQLQVNVQSTINKIFLVGAGLRGLSQQTMEGVIAFAGIKVNDRFTIAYSFDYPLAEIRDISDGSHEILIKYTMNKPIGKGRLPKIIYNPRFL